MAKVVSGGAAYQQLQVPPDGTSQALQYWGGLGAERFRQKQLAKEREKVRKAEATKEWEDTFGLKADDFKNKYTGFRNYDDVMTDASMYLTNEYLSIAEQARQARQNGDITEQRRLEGELIRQKNMFSEISKGQESLGKLYANYQKAAQEGKISGASKNFEDIMQSIFLENNVAIRKDPNGVLVLTGITPESAERYGLKTEGGEETGKPFVVPIQDLMDGSFSWYEKQQLSGDGGVVDNLASDLGEIVKERYQGDYKMTTKAWDAGEKDGIHTKATQDAINAMLSNDEVMGDLLYQLSGTKESKMSGFTDDDYKLVSEKLEGLVRASYNEKFAKDYDAGKARERRTGQEDGGTESTIEAEPITTVSGELTEGAPIQIPGIGKAGFELGGEYTLRTKGGKPIKGIITDEPKAEILTIAKSGGSYYVTIRKTEEESTSAFDTAAGGTQVSTKKLTDAELNRLARGMNLPTATDLDKYLLDRRNVYLQRTQQSQPTQVNAPTGGNVR